MWYVAQVHTGRESSTLDKCKRLVSSEILDDCFIPKSERIWRSHGESKLVERLLFPGYLFFVTDNVKALNKELKYISVPFQLLGDKDNTFFSLTEKEKEWFLTFMDESHIVRVSRGYIKGDKTIVTHGPLRGYEHHIRKIDRHKRLAYIDASLFGRTVPARFGLEIVKKIP